MKVLKFGAIWCKECMIMKPMWAEIEQEIPELKTEYYDADFDLEKAREFSVRDIPTFIFLDNKDKEFLRLVGVQNKEELIRIVKENINK
jgi:thiol-disulfide isomerase/thioredoxin